MEYVTADFAVIFEVADRYQEKGEPDQETHGVGQAGAGVWSGSCDGMAPLPQR
jgi:hypothetical protein